jgi:SAM-dependent methyltransferase
MTERSVALDLEVSYWESIASGTFRIEEWCAIFKRRARGDVFFPDYIVPYFRPAPGVTKVLDVGAGPHTTLGRPRTPMNVEITAIDPLAEAYKNILKKHGYTPRTPTIYGDAERLSEQFDDDVFDLVYSRNAIDHVANPEIAIREMLNVCRPGGVVFFEGNINEAVAQNYKQLHKWNFMTVEDGKNGDCVLWNADRAWLLSWLIGSGNAIRTWRTGWYKVEIRKQVNS